MRTAIIYHPDCRKHKMVADHPECSERLDAIQDRLLASGLDIAVPQIMTSKASEEFAARRMNAGIKKALKGYSLDDVETEI